MRALAIFAALAVPIVALSIQRRDSPTSERLATVQPAPLSSPNYPIPPPAERYQPGPPFARPEKPAESPAEQQSAPPTTAHSLVPLQPVSRDVHAQHETPSQARHESNPAIERRASADWAAEKLPSYHDGPSEQDGETSKSTLPKSKQPDQHEMHRPAYVVTHAKRPAPVTPPPAANARVHRHRRANPNAAVGHGFARPATRRPVPTQYKKSAAAAPQAPVAPAPAVPPTVPVPASPPFVPAPASPPSVSPASGGVPVSPESVASLVGRAQDAQQLKRQAKPKPQTQAPAPAPPVVPVEPAPADEVARLASPSGVAPVGGLAGGSNALPAPASLASGQPTRLAPRTHADALIPPAPPALERSHVVGASIRRDVYVPPAPAAVPVSTPPTAAPNQASVIGPLGVPIPHPFNAPTRREVVPQGGEPRGSHTGASKPAGKVVQPGPPAPAKNAAPPRAQHVPASIKNVAPPQVKHAAAAPPVHGQPAARPVAAQPLPAAQAKADPTSLGVDEVHVVRRLERAGVVPKAVPARWPTPPGIRARDEMMGKAPPPHIEQSGIAKEEKDVGRKGGKGASKRKGRMSAKGTTNRPKARQHRALMAEAGGHEPLVSHEVPNLRRRRQTPRRLDA